MDYRKLLLDKLLDKYENSAHFYGNSQINRRVALTFTAKTMPVYFAGDRPQDKNAIHQAVSELEGTGILTVEWVRAERNNLLKRVILNLEQLEDAYSIAGRTPKATELEEFAHLLAQTELETPWLVQAVNGAREVLQTKRKLPSPFPGESKDLKIFLNTLSGLDQKRGEEVPERIFSIRYLGNSKLFASKARTPLVALARAYRFSDPDLSDEDILAELGIVRTSAELLLAGPITIMSDGQTADLSSLPFGAVIDTHKAAHANIVALQTDTILLVENKTNFHELVRQGVTKRLLLIYLGGFPGPAKRNFLASLGRFIAQKYADIYHWGDIDYGGFRIFRILQEAAFPALKPLFMDEETLLRYQHMAEPLKSAYKNRLACLLQDKRYSHFNQVIEQMLAHNLRLEQEALLADRKFALPI